MHGHHSLLNLDLAQHWQEEELRKAAQRQRILEHSNPSPRARLSGIRQAVGSSLISIGERLRPEECGLIGDEVAADQISINLAR
jgi:hypothetical protein